MILSGYKLKGLAVAAGLSTLALLSNPAVAADFGGDCCADLEERVAVLEATTARKGNRKVSLTVSGHVNSAILFWDDGDDSDTYVVGNANDDLTMFRFEGDAKINSGWSAGYLIELEVNSASSGEVNQNDDDGVNELGISESSMFIESEQLGRVTWGFTAQPSDGAPEQDLSGAVYAGYAAIADVGGGFFWRLNNGGLTQSGTASATLGDVFDDLNGDTFNIIRYDTPTFAGFTLSAAWGENDLWDVSLTYENAWNDWEMAAAIGYTENSDNDDDGPIDHDTLAGSISVLHTPTGLNLTFAAGERQYNDGTNRPDSDFHYIKAGLFQKFNSLGKTAFYGEYGQYNDMFFLNGPDGADEQALVNLLDADANGACAAGVGCQVRGSEAKVWGFGVVQYIDAAAMQVYIAYRNHEVDFDVVDINGNAVASNGIEDFSTVLAGGRIEF